MKDYKKIQKLEKFWDYFGTLHNYVHLKKDIYILMGTRSSSNNGIHIVSRLCNAATERVSKKFWHEYASFRVINENLIMVNNHGHELNLVRVGDMKSSTDFYRYRDLGNGVYLLKRSGEVKFIRLSDFKESEWFDSKMEIKKVTDNYIICQLKPDSIKIFDLHKMEMGNWIFKEEDLSSLEGNCLNVFLRLLSLK